MAEYSRTRGKLATLIATATLLSALLSLISPAALAQSPAQSQGWLDYTNEAFGWSIRYPAGWHINQGDFVPAPPVSIKFSTYAAQAGQKVTLTPGDAEVWVIVVDAKAAGALPNLAGQGYTERKVTVAGLPATRYTASTPAFGLYDAVVLSVDGLVYRIYLSAATHDFDATFQAMLDSLQITVERRSAAGFSVRYPAGWKVSERPDSVSIEPPAGALRLQVVRQQTALPTAGQAIAEALSADPEMQGLQTAPGGAAMLAGLRAASLVYTYTRKSDSATLRGLDRAIKIGQVVYAVRCLAPAAEFASWEPACAAFAAGFRPAGFVTISDLLARPAAYENQAITIVANLWGQRKPPSEQPATAAPPVTAGDWLIEEGGRALYVQAGAPLTADSIILDLGGGQDLGKRLRLNGNARLSDKGQPYLEPTSIYPDVAGQWSWETQEPAPRRLTLDLSQDDANLAGALYVTSAQGATSVYALAGNLIEGRKMALKGSGPAAAVQISGTLSSDGLALSGVWQDEAAAQTALIMRHAEAALPTTGADLSWMTTAGLALLAALLVGAAGLGLALCAQR